MSAEPRIERDPAFWIGVAAHPEVERAMLGLTAGQLSACVIDPRVYPIRSERGGFLFLAMDTLGRAFDLHALFLPHAWGSEPAPLLKLALGWVFARGAQVITAHETPMNSGSRPPRSYGFEAAGPMAETPLGPFRTWVLTLEAWRASPAYRRMARCPQS